MKPGAENREAIRRSEPITMHWQPAEAVESVFVLLVFLLQTIIKAVWHHQFSHHNYCHANSKFSMGGQIISSLIWSTANCHNFLKKTLLFMRKLLSANWGFFFKNVAQTSRQNHAFIIAQYNQLFIEDDSFQPRKSNVGFFSQGNKTKKQKMLRLSGPEKKLLVFALPPANMHKCTHIYALQAFMQGAVASLRAKPCALLQSRSKAMIRKLWSFHDLKWKYRMDGSKIAVGFMPYYAGALILTAFLLRLEMKAGCWEGAELYYLSLSPVWGVCSGIRQPLAELCVPGSTEMRGFGHRQGLCGSARACEPLPCNASKAAECLWFCAFRVASTRHFSMQNSQACNSCVLCWGSLCFA